MGHSHSGLISLVDMPLAFLARLTIRVYQLTVSRRLNRTCLFAPTCSHRALALFRENGFFGGVAMTRAQLEQCRGNYSVRFDGQGAMELLTASGRVVSEIEINPQIIRRIKSGFNFDRQN